MVLKATLIWVLGLVTIVPYSLYTLFTHATKENLAFWITFPLFWIFGYWGVVGPILSALKVRNIFKALEKATSKEEWIKSLKENDSEDLAIEMIATENRIPKFLARKVYRHLKNKLLEEKEVTSTQKAL